MNFKDWLTTELFNYAKDNYLIEQDAIFEDWMNDRSDLLKICEENE